MRKMMGPILRSLVLIATVLGLGACDGEAEPGKSGDEGSPGGKADAPGTCREECVVSDCPEVAPANAKVCADGTTLEPDICALDENGGCGWTFADCPDGDAPEEPSCGPEDCGPVAPAIAEVCADGSTVVKDLCAPVDGGCAWTFPACPDEADDEGEDPSECGADDCGPFAPAIAKQCPDGSSVGKDVCAPIAGGCDWTFGPCP